MQPDILVLDEPTAMLDPTGRYEIIETVKKLNRENGMTIILITHYMEEAVQADRVIVINDGEVEISGKPYDVFSQVERLKKLGLDVPQATEFVFLLRKAGFDITDDAFTAEECADIVERFWREKRNGK